MQTTTGQVFALLKLFDDKYQAFIGGSLISNSLSGSFEWMHEEVGPSNLTFFCTSFTLE